MATLEETWRKIQFKPIEQGKLRFRILAESDYLTLQEAFESYVSPAIEQERERHKTVVEKLHQAEKDLLEAKRSLLIAKKALGSELLVQLIKDDEAAEIPATESGEETK